MNELEIIQHRQLEGLSIFFDTVEYRTPHYHPEWELAWVLDNPLVVTCGGWHAVAQPGDLILFNPNEPHEFHKEKDDSTILFFQFSPRALRPAQPKQIDEKFPNRHLPQNGLVLKTMLAKLMWKYLQNDDHLSYYCNGVACLIMYELLYNLPSHVLTAEELQTIERRNARLKRLIQFVDDNYMHKICLSDFAKQEGCSMSYLSRVIKQTLNQSFQEYVKSVRFNCACNLIASGKMRMLDVCMESGFSDYRYFSREFLRQYNMTPEEYRRHTKRLSLELTTVNRSKYSSERFYSKEESLILAQQFLTKYL